MKRLPNFALKCSPWLIGALWLIWFGGVLIHGLGFSVWGKRGLNFETAGQFGDSFGPLASLMAALAAAGAFLTLSQQQKLADDQRHDMEALRDRERIQDFEQTFYRLLNVLIEKTHRIDLSSTKTIKQQVVTQTWSGPDAFRTFARNIYISLVESPTDIEISKAYLEEFRYREADLSHYYRIVYHLILFIDSSPGLSDKSKRYEYARILRAQISHPEMLMILMNCLFGAGKEKFYPIAVRYDFFQHLQESNDKLTQRVCSILKERVDA